MERRILAELFVDDDRAIEEDMGTIDYVEMEAGWMSESGISVGRMRILDNDDPEDAKASDLADKIFYPEENDAISVYIVRADSTLDCSTDTDIKVFSTYEKAKAYFDECVADEKANDHLMELDDAVVNEEERYFSVYQDGFWDEDHYEISINEMEVR